MAKIMLVEDDNNLREIYEARLLAEGYEIVSAKDGEEALALAVKERPDLIISDVMMPKISGFDMLDILRSTPETQGTKVIMMTALSQAEDKARADKLGADRYLVKSQVTLEDVAKVAREVLAGEPEGGTPAAPAPEVTETPAIAAEPPADPPAVADEPPAADTPVAPPPAPLPAEDTSAASAPVVEPPDAAQSTAEEAATVAAQINDFTATAPDSPTPATDTPVAPPAAPAPAASPTDPIEVKEEPSEGDTNQTAETAEKMTEAVNDLLSKSEAPTSSREAERKTIEPLSDPTKKPDLNALLAKEEAKDAAGQAPGATPEPPKPGSAAPGSGDPDSIAL